MPPGIQFTSFILYSSGPSVWVRVLPTINMGLLMSISETKIISYRHSKACPSGDSRFHQVCSISSVREVPLQMKTSFPYG